MKGSEQGTEAPGKGIAESMKQRPVFPLIDPDLDRLGKIALKRGSHPPACFFVEHYDVALGIEVERAEIEIR